MEAGNGCAGASAQTETAPTGKRVDPGTAVVRIEIPKRKLSLDFVIRQEICKGCGFCVEFCPSSVLALSSKFNAKGYGYPEIVKPEACSGCKMCMMICPDYAIFFTEAGEK